MFECYSKEVLIIQFVQKFGHVISEEEWSSNLQYKCRFQGSKEQKMFELRSTFFPSPNDFGCAISIFELPNQKF